MLSSAEGLQEQEGQGNYPRVSLSGLGSSALRNLKQGLGDQLDSQSESGSQDRNWAGNSSCSISFGDSPSSAQKNLYIATLFPCKCDSVELWVKLGLTGHHGHHKLFITWYLWEIAFRAPNKWLASEACEHSLLTSQGFASSWPGALKCVSV